MRKDMLCLSVIALSVFFVVTSILTADTVKDKGINVEKVADGPEIVFKEQSHDFGKVYMGKALKYRFTFKNTGNRELIINNVKSSCGCTAALVSKNKLLKNEEGEVDITFNPGNYIGKATKSVVVNSNDPNNPRFSLTITAEIIEEVTLNPKRINFGTIRKGESCNKSISVKTLPGLKIEIKKVESPNPYITISQDKIGDNECSYRIVLNKYDYIGKFNGIIFVYTTSANQERIDVPFFGEIVGDVTFYPEILSFGNIQKGQDVKRTVIVNFLNKDVKIEKIEVNPDIMSCAISELSNSKKIDIRPNNAATSGKINGSLKIYTNSNIQPVINIPINGEIKG